MLSILKHHNTLPACSILTLVSLCALISMESKSPGNANSQKLKIHCAAGIKNAIEPATADFTHHTGIQIEITYGGSGVLLSDFRARPSGIDLFLAADDQYSQAARDFGLVSVIVPLASMQPVIAFTNTNPKDINNITDLFKDSLRVAIAHPDTAAIGKCTQESLATYGYWNTMNTQAAVIKTTVHELANDLKLQAVDAAIIWDATARQYSEIDFLYAPELASARSTISVGISSRTKLPKAAQLFTEFLSDPKRGGQYFEAWGYSPLNKNQHRQVKKDNLS